MWSSSLIGHEGEEIALNYLQSQGLQCLARNYRSQLGEIDLIMKDKDRLVFVEVRYRAGQSGATAPESVTRPKCLKIEKAASWYLKDKKLFDKVLCRFDVIAITGPRDHPKCRWIRSAFDSNLSP